MDAAFGDVDVRLHEGFCALSRELGVETKLVLSPDSGGVSVHAAAFLAMGIGVVSATYCSTIFQ
jgi:hypothetical protein